MEIDPTQPGYKHTIIRPQPGGGIEWAKAEYAAQYGTIGSHWRLEEGRFHLTVTVPANATATVCLPAGSAEQVTESGVSLADAPGVLSVEQQDGEVRVQIGSGEYTFVVA